jgi:hypothetical protein
MKNSLSMFIFGLTIALGCSQETARGPLSTNTFSTNVINDVALGTTGMHLIITDDQDAPSFQMMRQDAEINAEVPLCWILRNSSPNGLNSVVFLGISNSFTFDLKTTNGVSVQKTAKGVAMNAGPKFPTNFRANRVRRIMSGMQDFPALTELFYFPSNGNYIFEMRYWNWAFSKKEFQLSSPVRVRVVKSDTNAPPKPAAR